MTTLPSGLNFKKSPYELCLISRIVWLETKVKRRDASSVQAINQLRTEKDARYYFVEGQLRPNKVYQQSLINAALLVDREDFVPAPLRSTAYVDACLSLVDGRVMLSPCVLLRLINLFNLTPGQRCLSIGCVTGYALAIFKTLGVQAFGVDENQVFCEQANSLLKERYDVCEHVKWAPHAAGWLENGPYDAILIEGSVQEIPEHLFNQLSQDGKLVSIKWTSSKTGQAGIWSIVEGVVRFSPGFDTHVPILSGFSSSKKFVL